MALLSGLMPGEWEAQQGQAGQPEMGWQDKIGGLLSGDNALFNAGIGILANNNSKNTGRVLARGIQQGSQQTVANRNQKQEAELRKLQMKRYERESESEGAKEQAHVDFDTKFPEYAGLSRMNPAAAMKIAYPNANANTADPYFSDKYIGGKIYSYNHRTGEYIEKNLGGSTLPNKDDPKIRGDVKLAEAEATASYKPNTDIPGVVSTDLQVVQQANPNLVNPIPANVPRLPQAMPQAPQQMPSNNFNTPYPVTFGAPGTTATDQAEGVINDQSIQMRNPARPNNQSNYVPPIGGIRVPTAAQLAGETEKAKIAAQTTANAQQDLSKVVDGANRSLRQIDELVGSADGKIKPHPGFESAVGASSKFDPRNYLPGTDAAGFKARLDQSKGGTFLQAFESLKGAGQITEIEGTKATTALDRMNTATSEEEFTKAARDYQDVIRSATNRAKSKAGVSAIDAPKAAVNLLKLNPKLRDQFDAKYGAGAAAQVLGK